MPGRLIFLKFLLCNVDFKPPPTPENSSNRKKKILIVVGAVMFSLALILMILFVAWRKRRNGTLMEQGDSRPQLLLMPDK